MPSYVYAQPEGQKKPRCYRVTKGRDGGLVGAIPDETFYHDRVTIPIRNRDVIIPLGDNPPVGRVYGEHIEPIHERWLTKGWGEVFNYVPTLSGDMRARIQRSLLQARRFVRRYYPAAMTHDLITEVKHASSVDKTRFTYHYASKGTDRLTLRPFVVMGLRELVKLDGHEMGHNVWWRVLTPEERSAWIRVYGRFVTVREVTVRDVQGMVRSMRQMGSVRDYQRDAQPEEQAAVPIYLGWLKKVHDIDQNMVQDLLSAGDRLPIPDVHLHRSEKDTPVTLYSKSSPDEMFCEALSSAIVGDLKDRRLHAMLKGNLRAAGR